MIHVIVPTCDKYAPIIPKWLVYFYRTWTLPHRVTVLGVSRGSLRIPIELRWNPVTAVYTETDDGWATNLLRYVATLGNEPFLMMMDDHIMFEANTDLLRLAYKIITRDDVGCVRLVPWPGPTLPFERADSDTESFGEIDKRLEYAVSLQASFWKPQTLRDLLQPGWSPWQVEVEGSKRAAQYDKRFVCSKTCAVNYKDYYMRGKPRENHAAWVDEHL